MSYFYDTHRTAEFSEEEANALIGINLIWTELYFSFGSILVLFYVIEFFVELLTVVTTFVPSNVILALVSRVNIFQRILSPVLANKLRYQIFWVLVKQGSPVWIQYLVVIISAGKSFSVGLQVQLNLLQSSASTFC